jgi:aryl-alcohol dehydrogenase-like predicted oxidoreductase
MQRRRLGRTGHVSSVLIYGGAALADVSQDVADASIELALEAGIDHIDTAAAYGDSEVRLGAWMPRIRERVFVASKTGDRTADDAYDSVRRSLERLRTDRLDLIQLHDVGSLADLDAVTRTGGALEGVIRARDEGLALAIGITGHGMTAPPTHLEALRRFPFETVLTPFNHRLASDDRYRDDLEALEEKVLRQDVGLMFIKTLARNLWRSGEPHRYQTWYEPLEDQGHVDAAVAFALARPSATGIATPGDVRLLARVIDAERRAAAMTPERASEILERVDGYEPPFVRTAGRDVPDWLEHLIP